jgi:hypothetical protein
MNDLNLYAVTEPPYVIRPSYSVPRRILQNDASKTELLHAQLTSIQHLTPMPEKTANSASGSPLPDSPTPDSQLLDSLPSR